MTSIWPTVAGIYVADRLLTHIERRRRRATPKRRIIRKRLVKRTVHKASPRKRRNCRR